MVAAQGALQRRTGDSSRTALTVRSRLDSVPPSAAMSVFSISQGVIHRSASLLHILYFEFHAFGSISCRFPAFSICSE